MVVVYVVSFHFLYLYPAVKLTRGPEIHGGKVGLYLIDLRPYFHLVSQTHDKNIAIGGGEVGCESISPYPSDLIYMHQLKSVKVP